MRSRVRPLGDIAGSLQASDSAAGCWPRHNGPQRTGIPQPRHAGRRHTKREPCELVSAPTACSPHTPPIHTLTHTLAHLFGQPQPQAQLHASDHWHGDQPAQGWGWGGGGQRAGDVRGTGYRSRLQAGSCSQHAGSRGWAAGRLHRRCFLKHDPTGEAGTALPTCPVLTCWPARNRPWPPAPARTR